MQTQTRMGTVRVIPIDDVIKNKSLKKKTENTTKASIHGEIRLSPGGVQLRVASPKGSGPSDHLPLTTSSNTAKLKGLIYRSISRKSRDQEMKEAFMTALALQPKHAPPRSPTTKAHVANVLGGTKAIKSFLRSPVTPLTRVACMAAYFRHKGALVQFTPPAPQTKPKTAKNAKMKKANLRFSVKGHSPSVDL